MNETFLSSHSRRQLAGAPRRPPRWTMVLLLALACLLPGPGQSLLAGATWPALRDLAVLVDPSGQETIAGIARTDPARFTPLPGGSLAAGYTRAAHWLRFTLNAPAGEWWLDILPPFLDDVRLFEPDPAQPGQFLERRTGSLLPFAAREVPYRGFIFKLHQPDDQPRTYYLRLATASSSVLVPRLWAPEDFHAAATLEAGLLFTSLAVLLTVLLLSLNHWFWLRDPLSPWFIAYIGALAFNTATAVTGFVFQYLLPAQPLIARHLVGVSTLTIIAFGSGFYRRLFGVDRNQPLPWGLYQVGFWLPLGAIPPVLWNYRPEVMPLMFDLVLLINCLNLVLAFHLWRRRGAGAGFIFAGNLISLSGIMVIVLHLLGLIGGGLPPLYSMQVASLGTALTLYLAVGARYRALQQERQREQERAEQALIEARREREAREEQSGLFAMISHEIKTPLTMIDGAVQALEALVTSKPEIDRRHQRIRRAVARINGLVEKTLEYDRVGQDTKTPEGQSPLDLARLAASLIREYALPAARLNLKAADPCRVRGNPGLIEVLIANLVDNALKYSPAETLVEVRLGVEGPAVFLEVRDRGRGVPPALRPTLFDRYVRGANVGDITGAGLGLYLVRRIARWHGGDVELEDPAGGGSCFRVTLPKLNSPVTA